MRALLYHVLLSGAALLSVAVSAQQPESQGALIEFGSKVYDLGTLTTDDDKQMLRIPFTNEGDVPLVVLEVRTSCSCTTVHCDRRKVMPGERGVLNVTMDPAKAPAGNFYRVLEVISSAANSPTNLTLKAAITE